MDSENAMATKVRPLVCVYHGVPTGTGACIGVVCTKVRILVCQWVASNETVYALCVCGTCLCVAYSKVLSPQHICSHTHLMTD